MSIYNGGYVYQIVHRETGKWYIGSHNGTNPNYTGSGVAFRKALKKYGRDAFDKEIFYQGPLFREEEEKMLIEMNATNDPMSYNMKNTAFGAMLGQTHSEETIARMSAAHKLRWAQRKGGV